MRSRSAQRVAVGVVIVAVVIVGAVLWVLADDETKQADMGTALLSSGTFGLLLLVFERVLTEHTDAISDKTEAVRRAVNLSAAPDPAMDTRVATEASPDPAEATDEPPAPGRPPRRFEIRTDGWMRDGSRVDADQLRLPVYCDDEYFQFFTAIIPGIAFRMSVHSAAADGVTLAQFRRAIARLAVEHVREAILSGEAPRKDNPIVAIELFPDPDEAIRTGRHEESTDYSVGDVVAEIIV